MNTRKTLLTWGGVLLLVSVFGGLYLGPQATPTRAAKKAHFVKAFELLSAQESDMGLAELEKGIQIEDNHTHLSVTHSHVACMAFLTLLLGLVERFLGLSNKWKAIMAWLLISGTILHPTGVLVEMSAVCAGEVLAGIGASLIILSVITAFVGILKYVHANGSSPAIGE